MSHKVFCDQSRRLWIVAASHAVGDFFFLVFGFFVVEIAILHSRVCSRVCSRVRNHRPVTKCTLLPTPQMCRALIACVQKLFFSSCTIYFFLARNTNTHTQKSAFDTRMSKEEVFNTLRYFLLHPDTLELLTQYQQSSQVVVKPSKKAKPRTKQKKTLFEPLAAQ